jgi:hypothetical protein
MAWVDSAVNGTKNETGVSEILGAIILMGVIAAAIGIIGVGLLSQPIPQKIPAVSVDVTAMDNIVYIRHEGGDSLAKGEFSIMLDGADATDSFMFLDGTSSGSAWTPGKTLYYVVPSGQNVPASVQILYNSGSSASLGDYTPTIITAPYALQVNTGGPSYTDTTGNVWSGDQAYSSGGWGYIGGNTYSTTSSISGTTDPKLYQTERYFPSGGGYDFTVPDGNYHVTLKFAEIYFTSPSQRIFDVTIEGTPVMSNVDLYALAGPNTAYDKTFTVTVNDHLLNIAFINVVENPKISAIQIVNA